MCGVDHDYNDEEEDKIIVVFEKVCKVKKKHTYQELIGAFDMIQLFMHEEKLPLDHRLALERLVWYSVQTHQMQKPKASLTIRNFFQALPKV